MEWLRFVSDPEKRLSVWRLQVLWLLLAVFAFTLLSGFDLSILLVLGVVAVASALGVWLENQTTSLAQETRAWLTALSSFQKAPYPPKQLRIAHFGAGGTIDLALIQLGVILLLVLRALFCVAIDWRWAVLLALSETIYLAFGLSTLAAKREMEALASEAAKREDASKKAGQEEAIGELKARAEELLERLNGLVLPALRFRSDQEETSRLPRI